MSQRFAACPPSVGQQWPSSTTSSDPHSFNQPLTLSSDVQDEEGLRAAPSTRQQQRLRDTVRNEISGAEIDDVGHVVFGSSRRGAGSQPTNGNEDLAVQSILRVHADEAMVSKCVTLRCSSQLRRCQHHDKVNWNSN